MPLQLYNTLNRTKEEFVPVTPGYAGIYYCGPTVYSAPHLGHARGPVIFDVLKRWLQHEGMQVRLVSNITDVGHLTDDADEGEDKLLQRAALERVEPMELADRYFWAYQDAMARLNVLRPDITPRASGHITEQIELIIELFERGLAYESAGSVYFEVSKWADYGVLSGRSGDDQITGTRVALRDEKRDPRDFALWKHAEPGHIMRWPSPWGEGYPGWHIECSAMSLKYLGSEFDIHGGGVDLVFPHHEAEIAQSCGAGHAFARHWMHFNTITLGGEKMARSRNHYILLQDLFSRIDPMDVRFYLLHAHYRSVMDFTEEGLAAATSGLRRLQDTYRLLLARQPEPASVLHADLDVFRQRFGDAMNDDLNTPQALAALFDAAREINRELPLAPSVQYLQAARFLFDDLFNGVLGLTSHTVGSAETDGVLSGVIDLLLEQRKLARQQRDFAAADRIRLRLADLGVIIEDTEEGSRWKLA